MGDVDQNPERIPKEMKNTEHEEEEGKDENISR